MKRKMMTSNRYFWRGVNSSRMTIRCFWFHIQNTLHRIYVSILGSTPQTNSVPQVPRYWCQEGFGCHHLQRLQGYWYEDQSATTRPRFCTTNSNTVRKVFLPNLRSNNGDRCDECGGKGKKVTSTCPHCSGRKVEVGEETIMVAVERGMQDGEKIVNPHY